MHAARLFASSFLRPIVYALVAGVGATLVGGWLAWLLWLAVAWNVGILLLRIMIHHQVARAILTNHPENLEAAPATEPPTEAFIDLERALQALGFESASPLLLLPMNPPATLRGFVLPGRPVYATVFQSNGNELGFDFVSVVEGRRGGLTTSSNPKAATLPGVSGSLRQIFPDLAPAELLHRHLDALVELERRGVRFDPATSERLLPALRTALARTRAEFLRNRFTWTQLALQRVATNVYPDQGAVLERAELAPAIESLARAA